MLFTCCICNFGHDALNVEGFTCPVPGKGRRHVYLCKKHLSMRKPTWMHQPWLDNSSDYCKVCADFGDTSLCYGKNKQPGIIIRGTGENFCIEREEKQTYCVNFGS